MWLESSIKEDKESTSFCHINRRHVVRNLLRHLCSVGTDHILVTRPKVSIFNESVITHARKPLGLWSSYPQQLMKPATGNPTITSIICFNDGQVIHIVQFFSSYYRVVVYKLLSKSCATLLGMLWIGILLLPLDGFRKAPTTAPLSVR